MQLYQKKQNNSCHFRYDLIRLNLIIVEKHTFNNATLGKENSIYIFDNNKIK